MKGTVVVNMVAIGIVDVTRTVVVTIVILVNVGNVASIVGNVVIICTVVVDVEQKITIDDVIIF